MNPQAKKDKQVKQVKQVEKVHKTTHRAASILATLVAAGLLLAACSSGTPSASKKFVPIPGVTSPPTTKAAPPCPTKPTIQVIDTEKFQNWTKTCIGKSALSTYRDFIATVNQVWSDPFQNGYTARQEIQYLATQQFNGSGTKLPKGCNLSNLRPGLLPPACASLAKDASSSIFAPEMTVLEQVASPSVAAEVMQMQLAAIKEGRTPQGSLSGTGDAVVRYAGLIDHPLPGTAPSLSGAGALPHFHQLAHPSGTAHLQNAVVWSCTADHLTATGLAKSATPWIVAPVSGGEFLYGPDYPVIPIIVVISASRIIEFGNPPYGDAHSCSPAF
ncbi:MAG: hypothetical protein ACYCST_04560 [Acidimicrobiales bacterium]